MTPPPGRYQYPTSLKAISFDAKVEIGRIRKVYRLYFPNTKRLSNTMKLPPLLATMLYERVMALHARSVP